MLILSKVVLWVDFKWPRERRAAEWWIRRVQNWFSVWLVRFAIKLSCKYSCTDVTFGQSAEEVHQTLIAHVFWVANKRRLRDFNHKFCSFEVEHLLKLQPLFSSNLKCFCEELWRVNTNDCLRKKPHNDIVWRSCGSSICLSPCFLSPSWNAFSDPEFNFSIFSLQLSHSTHLTLHHGFDFHSQKFTSKTWLFPGFYIKLGQTKNAWSTLFFNFWHSAVVNSHFRSVLWTFSTFFNKNFKFSTKVENRYKSLKRKTKSFTCV